MIGMRTILEVADNSGARRLQAILPRGGDKGLRAGLGDIVTASVKEAAPDSAIKKGKVVKCVIVRMRKETRRKDGTVVIAAWNYAEPVGNTDQYTPGKPKGETRHFQFDVAYGGGKATVWRLDETHGNAVAAFDAMGRPPFPSREQIVQLRKAGEMAPAEDVTISGGKLDLDIPPQGLVVIEIPAAGK